jgi:hypothetical protein
MKIDSSATEFLERKFSESVIRRVDRFPVSMIPGVSDLSIIDKGSGGLRISLIPGVFNSSSLKKGSQFLIMNISVNLKPNTQLLSQLCRGPVSK